MLQMVGGGLLGEFQGDIRIRENMADDDFFGRGGCRKPVAVHRRPCDQNGGQEQHPNDALLVCGHFPLL